MTGSYSVLVLKYGTYKELRVYTWLIARQTIDDWCHSEAKATYGIGIEFQSAITCPPKTPVTTPIPVDLNTIRTSSPDARP